ncbi:ANTAR domain-containing protein [Streptomyces sp. NPDC050534]|uniref:ANTAR domain-containing protein n=1 Tax=Streptomyces sp. NPDC050534 TaxID=3365625 RepID=UPI0037B6DBD9
MDPRTLEPTVRHDADRSPGMDQVVEAQSAQIHDLESRLGQLEIAVESHAVVDQAMGVLIAVGRLSPDEAWDILRETSMSTNIKLRHVAGLVVAWGRTGRLATDIQGELSRRLGPPRP